MATAICVMPKAANELAVSKGRIQNTVSHCTFYGNSDNRSDLNDQHNNTPCLTLSKAHIYQCLLDKFSPLSLLNFILQTLHHSELQYPSPHPTRPVMAESLVYKPCMDLSPNTLFRLSLYYIYVSPKTWKVASLLNQLHRLPQGIATQEVKSTYLHLHDTEHPTWVRAKDMARKEPDELKRILRYDIGMDRAGWDVRVVQPVMAMAQLRLIQD